jgi:cytochrome o ubiquinol oxidase operon protein cyoD
MLDKTHRSNRDYTSLTAGVILSLLCILAAWFAVTEHLMTGWGLIVFVGGFGSLQMLLQVFLFLHLGIEQHPRWNMMMFFFMVIVLLIVISGSMWIMYNLDYHMMPMDGGH